MIINPINNQSYKNKTNFQANVKLSPDFNQYYTSGKLEEVTKQIHSLGSLKDSVKLTLDNSPWRILCDGIINGKSFERFLRYDTSRDAVLRKILEALEYVFKSAYGENYKNIDKQGYDFVKTAFIQQEPKSVIPQKNTEAPVEKVAEKVLSKEIEDLINKKVDEKIKNLLETKLESIVEKVVLRQLKTNKNVERDIQEIIKNSTEEVGRALIELTSDYTNSRMNPNHPKRYILGRLHNRLRILLELARDSYRGGYYSGG